MIAVLTTIVVFGSLLLLPHVDKIPGSIIPVVYGAIADTLVQKYQGSDNQITC
jgi:hypothetical protein